MYAELLQHTKRARMSISGEMDSPLMEALAGDLTWMQLPEVPEGAAPASGASGGAAAGRTVPSCRNDTAAPAAAGRTADPASSHAATATVAVPEAALALPRGPTAAQTVQFDGFPSAAAVAIAAPPGRASPAPPVFEATSKAAATLQVSSGSGAAGGDTIDAAAPAAPAAPAALALAPALAPAALVPDNAALSPQPVPLPAAAAPVAALGPSPVRPPAIQAEMAKKLDRLISKARWMHGDASAQRLDGWTVRRHRLKVDKRCAAQQTGKPAYRLAFHAPGMFPAFTSAKKVIAYLFGEAVKGSSAHPALSAQGGGGMSPAVSGEPSGKRSRAAAAVAGDEPESEVNLDDEREEGDDTRSPKRVKVQPQAQDARQPDNSAPAGAPPVPPAAGAEAHVLAEVAAIEEQLKEVEALRQQARAGVVQAEAAALRMSGAVVTADLLAASLEAARNQLRLQELDEESDSLNRKRRCLQAALQKAEGGSM